MKIMPERESNINQGFTAIQETCDPTACWGCIFYSKLGVCAFEGPPAYWDIGEIVAKTMELIDTRLGVDQLKEQK